MADFDNSDANLVGDIFTVTGTADDDLFTITSTFVTSGISGLIDGAGGSDTLALNSANVTTTVFASIEATELFNSSQNRIDADQIANLGTITLAGNAPTFGGNIRLDGPSGGVANFSGLSLLDGERLNVTAFLSTGETISADFSGASFAGSSFISYTGSSQDDVVTGGTGDDSILGSSGDDSLRGGEGNDTLDGSTGDDTLRGEAGNDLLRDGSTSANGLLDGGADDDRIEIASTYTNSAIDGGTGTDTLQLNSVNMTGTTVAGIEATELFNSSQNRIDADQIANLGTIALTGNAPTFGGNIRLDGPSGGSADFSGLSLLDGERLNVSAFLNSGQTITADFSGASFAGSSFIDYDGSSQDDVVTGGSGNDDINGSSGNDSLRGGDGNDTLDGSTGDDTLRGEAGNDLLRDGSTSANGLLEGGADDDRIEIASTYTNSAIDGGTGTDTLRLNSVNMTGTTVAGIEATELFNNSQNRIDADQIANLGTITLTGNAPTFGGNIRLDGPSGGSADFAGLSLADGERLIVSAFLNTGQTISADFSGAAFAGSSFVTYTGSSQDDVVTGGSGNDEINGSSGNDSLRGGDGNDTLDGSTGDDTLRGEGGDDVLRDFGSQNGVIDGGADDDRIELVSTFTDGEIIGGGGTDTLDLRSANLQGTTISGIEATELDDNGTNTVDAAQVANLGTITLTGNAAAFNGIIRLSGPSGGVADFSGLSLQDGDELVVNTVGFTTGDTITADFSGGAFAGSSFVDYDGSSQNDVVIGGIGDDEIFGSGGNDSLRGGLGDDTIDGSSGDDTLRGEGGNDLLTDSGSQNGIIDGGADDDRIEISNTFTSGQILGGSGTDTLELASANLTGTTVSGIEATEIANNGEQFVDADQVGNLGAITLTASAVTFGGLMRLTGPSGGSADFSGLALADGESLRVRAFLNAGETIAADFSGGAFAGSSFIDYDGSSQDDVVIGGSGDDDINGSNGDDSLRGGLGDDTITGGSGDDTLRGEGGNDLLIENSGSSAGVIDGGADADRIEITSTFTDGQILGGTGADALQLVSANLSGTTLSGIEATEIANSGEQFVDADQVVNLGAITLTGTAITFGGLVRLTGPSGGLANFSGLSLADGETLQVRAFLGAGETIAADFSGASFAGSSFINYDGSSQDDLVTGGSGDDDLNGSSGDDSLSGGDGNDTLTGSSGVDTLLGGNGDDLLIENTGDISAGGVMDGGADDDRLEIVSNYRDSAIIGGTGTDTLALRSVDLRGTTISGIEATLLEDNGVMTIDADQVANLGAVSFTSTASTVNGFVQLSAIDGRVVDFSNFTVGADENLRISTLGAAAGQTLTVDVSGASYGANATTRFDGFSSDDTFIASSALDTFSGSSGSDTISYAGSTAGGVSINFATQTLSGGDAEGDTMSSVENAIGSEQGDVFTMSSATFSQPGTAVRVDGGAGVDTAIYADALGPIGSENYLIVTTGAITTVTDLNTSDGNDGVDTFINVEQLQFADRTVQIGVLPTPTLSIAAVQGILAEGDSGATAFEFTVTRTGDDSVAVSADFAVTPASGLLAAEADDFIGGAFPTGVVNFAAGETTQTVTIEVAGDAVFESDEGFVVTLSNPVDAELGVASASTVIDNDDASATPISVISRFDPQIGQLISVAFDATTSEIAVYESFNAEVQIYAQDGTLLRSLPRPGGSANDYDLDIATESLTLNGTVVPAGSILAVDGESGPAEIYAIDPSDGTLLATLGTGVGAGSIVGGSHHPLRDSFYLVEFTTEEVFEIDPDTGALLQNFDLSDYGYDVNFGDVAVDPTTGDLLIVSSARNSILRLSPDGDLLDQVTLPAGVSGLSGVAPIDEDEIYVTSTGGDVIRLGFFAAGNLPPVVSQVTATFGEEETGRTVDLLSTASDPNLEDLDVRDVSFGGRAFTVDEETGILTIGDGQFDFVPGGQTRDFTISYNVTDGANIVANTARITIEGENDAPTADNDIYSVGFNAAFTLGARGVLIGDFDVDGDALSAVLVEDVSNGSLTLNADGSLSYTPDAGFSGDDSFTYRASDGTAESDLATVTLRVAPNNPPDAVADTASTDEDRAVRIAVLANDSDPDSHPLSIFSAGNAALGTTAIDGSDIVFTPAPDANGQTTFSYTISDGNGGFDSATVTVTIAAQPDAPEATEDGYTTGFGETLAVAAGVGVLANDDDADGDALTATLVDDVTVGALDFASDGSFEYVPLAGFVGDVTFTYRASDGALESDNATVTISVGANPLPDAVGDTATVDEDGSVDIDVLANDSDPQGDPLSVASTTDPANGSATILANGQVRYVPDADFNGTDTFSYTITDGTDTDTATVQVTVNAVNDAPTGVDDEAETDFQTAVTIDVLANDTDIDDAPGDLFVSELFADENTFGQIALDANGDIVFTPDDGFAEIARFGYEVSDGDMTSTAEVSVEVGGPGARTFTVDALSIVEGDAGTTSAQLRIVRTGDLRVVDTLSGTTRSGSATEFADFAGSNISGSFGVGISILLLPLAAFGDTDIEGFEQFFVDFTISSAFDNFSVDADGAPAGSAFDFTAPVGIIDDDAALSVGPASAEEGDGSITFTITRQGDLSAVEYGVRLTEGTATDPEDYGGQFLPIQFADGQDEATLTVSLVDDDVVEDDETFTLSLIDDQGAVAASGVGTILNDDFAPVAVDDAFATNEDARVFGNLLAANPDVADSDADGDPLTVVSVTSSSGVVRPVNAATGSGLFILASGAHLRVSADGSFTYDPFGFGFPGTFGLTDFDRLDDGETGVETFTYVVTDGNGGFDEATATITVTGVNDAPIAVIDSISLSEDDAQGGVNLLDGDIGPDVDPEGGPLAVTQIAANGQTVAVDPLLGGVLTLASGASITVLADGTATFFTNGAFEDLGDLPGQLAQRNVNFTYTVADQDGLTDTALLQVFVAGVNDAPVAMDDGVFAAVEGEATSLLDVLANDDDPEGDALSIVGSDAFTVLGGQVVVAGDGRSLSVDYSAVDLADLAEGETRADSFEYFVSDGDLADAATVSLTLTGKADDTTPNEVLGTEGSDFVTGTDGADHIRSLGGRSDVILGLGGGDLFDFSDSTANGAREVRLVLDFDAAEDSVDLGAASVLSFSERSGQVTLFLDGDMDVVTLRGVEDFDAIAFA